MLFEKKKWVNVEVLEIDVKNFPVASRLPHASSISRDTFDIVRGRLQRHRDEFRRLYNEQHQRQQLPPSLRTDAEVDGVAVALQRAIPVATEYMRLKETSNNLEQISQRVQGEQVVYWMGITATFGGSKRRSVLATSIKEGKKSFSWSGADLQSNMSLPVVRCFPLLFHKHTSVEEHEPLQFSLHHHWKPRDEKTISSGENIVSTLACAKLPLEKISLSERTTTICRNLPLMAGGQRLAVSSDGGSPQMRVKISISFGEL